MATDPWSRITPEDWQQIMRNSYGDGPDDPPRFDWQRLLPRADDIIERVAKPKYPPAAKNVRPPRNGRDLSCFREDIAVLLADLHEGYLVALDDFQSRNDPNKPDRWGDDGDNRSIAPQTVDPTLDELFAEYAGAGYVEEPGDMWDGFYKRKRGNPGWSRTGGPPVPPLHKTYLTAQAWWQTRKLGRFTPNFANGDDERHHNEASRFLLAVMQSLDRNYNVENARGLFETMRKRQLREK